MTQAANLKQSHLQHKTIPTHFPAGTSKAHTYAPNPHAFYHPRRILPYINNISPSKFVDRGKDPGNLSRSPRSTIFQPQTTLIQPPLPSLLRLQPFKRIPTTTSYDVLHHQHTAQNPPTTPPPNPPPPRPTICRYSRRSPPIHPILRIHPMGSRLSLSTRDADTFRLTFFTSRGGQRYRGGRV